MMKKQLLEFFSDITSAPIFAGIIFLVLVLLYFFEFSLSLYQATIIFIISIIFATIIPLGYILKYSRKRGLSSYDLPIRKQRYKPYLIAIISYIFGAVFLFSIGAPLAIKGLMFCYITNTIVMACINFRWKISAHASGITGPLTILIYFFGWFFAPLWLIVIPVGYIRIKLERHTIMQVTAGALLTIIITWLQAAYIIVPYF